MILTSITYWHPAIYEVLMKYRYGTGYIKRYEVIRQILPNDCSLLDVACGDGKLYGFLKGKNISYCGLDMNPTFVRHLKERGINAQLANLKKDSIPHADHVLIQASLYQFYPDHGKILNKLFQAAKKSLIVSEPISGNVAQTKKRWTSFIARKLNNPGDGEKTFRFDATSIQDIKRQFGTQTIEEHKTIGPEYIIQIYR